MASKLWRPAASARRWRDVGAAEPAIAGSNLLAGWLNDVNGAGGRESGRLRADDGLLPGLQLVWLLLPRWYYGASCRGRSASERSAGVVAQERASGGAGRAGRVDLRPADVTRGTGCRHSAEAVLDRLIEDSGRRLSPRVAEALARIDGTGRRLLALRSYLRSGDRLAERWSWTQQQIASSRGRRAPRSSRPRSTALREAFTRDNPGSKLWVNPQVRSLDRQLESWNSNDTVAAAAAGLAAAALELVSSPSFPAADPDRARKALESLLAGHRPVPLRPSPRLASRPMGRCARWISRCTRATASSPVPDRDHRHGVDAAGWSAKLDAAVRSASRRFVGRWPRARALALHYSPEAVAAD